MFFFSLETALSAASNSKAPTTEQLSLESDSAEKGGTEAVISNDEGSLPPGAFQRTPVKFIEKLRR